MRNPLVTLAATLLLALSLVAAAFGLADIYRNEAAIQIDAWDGSAEEGPPAWAWEQAQRYLWLASRLAPFDAQILGELGQLYERKAIEMPTTNPTQNLEHALRLYRQALALRPAWPDAWLDVALLKLTQEQIDAEFAYSLQRALTLGPGETRVQASIASGGLAAWDQLPATLQTEIEQSIARGLATGSRLMPMVARRFGLFETDEADSAPAPTNTQPPEG